MGYFSLMEFYYYNEWYIALCLAYISKWISDDVDALICLNGIAWYSHEKTYCITFYQYCIIIIIDTAGTKCEIVNII